MKRERIPAHFHGGSMDGKVLRGPQATFFVAWDFGDGPIEVYRRGEVYDCAPGERANGAELVPRVTGFTYTYDHDETMRRRKRHDEAVA